MFLHELKKLLEQLCEKYPDDELVHKAQNLFLIYKVDQRLHFGRHRDNVELSLTNDNLVNVVASLTRQIERLKEEKRIRFSLRRIALLFGVRQDELVAKFWEFSEWLEKTQKKVPMSSQMKAHDSLKDL